MTHITDLFFDADISDAIARDFKAYLNEWHAIDEVRDSDLDAQIHAWYAERLKRKWTPPESGRHYFSPSSVNSCRRELYVKLLGAKRDRTPTQPHQGRWKRLGTSIGDMIQRDLLFAERHYERLTFKAPPFVFERNDDGTPVFEEFAQRDVEVVHNGQTFGLYGTCDGIMRYNGIRVGLEIKSKQTTFSQTGDYAMRNGPKDDHVKQCIAYSIMYGVDYYVIAYINASKKAWNMTTGDAEKYPDIAVFCIHVTDADRAALLDDLSAVLDAVDAKTPPAVDLTRITFNNYKAATAASLTQDEIDDLGRQVDAIKDDRQRQYAQEALETLLALRTEVTSDALPTMSHVV